MRFFIFIFLILINSAAWAGKIGTVDLDFVISKLKIYDAVDRQINTLIIKKNNELKLIKNKIEEKERLLKSGILNNNARTKISEEINSLNQQKDLFIRQAQKEVDTREQELRYPIIKKVLLTVKFISKRDNFDLIIEESTPILEKNVTIHNLNNEVILLLNN